MWSAMMKWGRQVVGLAVGAVAALAGFYEGARLTLPDYFKDPEMTEFRTDMKDHLADLREEIGANEVLLNKIRKELSEHSGLPSKISFTPGAIGLRGEMFAPARRPLRLARAQTASQQAEAVSGRTGLIGGRKIDYREACLPAVGDINYDNVRIARLDDSDRELNSEPFADADALSDDGYSWLTSSKGGDKNRFIRNFDAGCYAHRKGGRDGQRCVIAVAISKESLGAASVTRMNCGIRGDY